MRPADIFLKLFEVGSRKMSSSSGGEWPLSFARDNCHIEEPELLQTSFREMFQIDASQIIVSD